MKFEYTRVYNIEGAMRGMRNPLQSHHKSDSVYSDRNNDFAGMLETKRDWVMQEVFGIGKNDMQLAQKLVLAGEEHAKFLRQIFVSVDITAPLYWLTEFVTYKIGTSMNSASTMHTITKRDLTIDDFEIVKDANVTADLIGGIASGLNTIRNSEFLSDYEKLVCMKTLLPTSYKQTVTWAANYAVLRNIYFQRKNHRLPQWRVDFVNWIEGLPYAKELIMLKRGVSDRE